MEDIVLVCSIVSVIFDKEGAEKSSDGPFMTRSVRMNTP
jgi:hypothetical protein